MQRGRKQTPAHLHLVNGNRSKLSASELKQRTSFRPDVKIPKCPGHLTPVARKEWKRITVELEKLHVISELDMAALAAYCQAYATWVHAQEKLNEPDKERYVVVTPSGYSQQGPWLQIANAARAEMLKFGVEFGLTPSSRSRVDPARSTTGDIFQQFGNEPKEQGPEKFFS